MFLGMIRPSAEAEVRNLLLPLFSNLACSAMQDTKDEMESSPPAGDAESPNEQVPSTSTLLQRAEKLVPELVTVTLNYLLEDREELLWGSLFNSEQLGLTSIEGLWAPAPRAGVQGWAGVAPPRGPGSPAASGPLSPVLAHRCSVTFPRPLPSLASP